MKPVRIARRALEEMKSARDWYSERDRQVADRLDVVIDSTIAAIGATPSIGSPWPGVPELRRTRVAGFPYWAVYALGEEIIVVAFAHHRRRPLYWLSP